MSGAGRPLRFLLLVLGGWIGVRTWQLWPEPPLPSAVREVARRAIARAAPPTSAVRAAAGAPVTRRSVATVRGARSIDTPAVAAPRAPHDSTSPPVVAAVATTPIEATPAYVMGLLGMVRYGTPTPPPPAPRRWSASGWAIVRGAGPAAGVATPQLGGAQAGLRVARTLDAAGRFAIAGRVAAALGSRQQEAALGVEWRPSALPVRVVAERRIGLANQRGGTALGLVGGVSEQPLPAGLRLDGYAQAGAVIRDGVEGYADGAVRVARAIVRGDGEAVVSLGVGMWGAAQRGAARLDAGPSATIELPIGDAPRLRVALEWRQRLAGGARPTSGPVLSIGTDF